jgi:hypothetical protein
MSGLVVVGSHLATTQAIGAELQTSPSELWQAAKFVINQSAEHTFSLITKYSQADLSDFIRDLIATQKLLSLLPQAI